jgi:hypothetical protein
VRFKANNELAGANPTKLITWLTDGKADPKDVKSFAIAFRMFFSPDMLFNHIRSRFTVPASVKLANHDVMQRSTLQLLREWIMSSFASDFLENAQLLENVRAFLSAIVSSQGTSQEVRILAQQLP